VTLVARRGRIVYLEAAGKADVEEGRAIEIDSIFRIASMTKPIVSLAVMMLHERAALDDRYPGSSSSSGPDRRIPWDVVAYRGAHRARARDHHS
jgi:hypothetical protein